MREYVSRTDQACSFHVRQLHSVRRPLGRDITTQQVVALVFSRLHYCNAMLAGLLTITQAPLKQVLHATARWVNDLRPHYHTLKELHWLPIAQRIEYKLCLLVYKSSLIGNVLVLISRLLTAVSEVPSWSALHDKTTMKGNFFVPRTRLKLGPNPNPTSLTAAAPQAGNWFKIELYN